VSTPTYYDVKKLDDTTGSKWLVELGRVCKGNAIPGRFPGVFYQFRTDWINGGLKYAVSQTLRYVGFGYKNGMVFREVGEVIGEMLSALEPEE